MEAIYEIMEIGDTSYHSITAGVL